MPLFDLLRGKLSAEELMASIEALPVAAREYATLEAHFYISQAYLAAKQPRRADEHLNWLARYGLLGSSFEVLADGDKYSAERADADMREAWRLKVERGSNNSIVRHLKAAAEKGIPVAQRDLGVRYVRADEVMSDAPKGMALLQAAADKGDVDAMNHLGVIYADGAYVKNDNALAMRYYRQAAQNGDPYAAYNLGRIYWFGEKGAAIDLEQSFRYMRDASEMMSADAQFFLARMYFEGKGTDKNDSLAMFWAAQGFYRNDVDSAALLGLLILSLQTDEAPRAVGMNLLLRAANKGNSFAQLEYGRILLKSAQSDSDRGQIFQLIQLAANDGNDRAQALLGRMYVEGIGVKVDVAKGMEYLQRHEKKICPMRFISWG